MIKKRRHKRIPLTGSAVLKLKDQDQSLHAMTRDISISGIGLYSDIPLEDNMEVSLVINFISISGLIKTDSVGGRIVYVRKLEDIYFMGIEFDKEINQEKQPFLYEHLQRILILD
jgi:c-di-GMP-binding flagellar brake protein YcgR